MLILSSCELESTQYEIHIVNNTSYPLIMDYEMVNGNETITLEKGQHIGPYYVSFQEVLPELTEETFGEMVYSVKIGVILENGDTLTLSRNFADFENWLYDIRYDDWAIIYSYGLNLTDEDLE